MEVLLRSLYGVAAAIPLRIGPTRGGTAEVLNMFTVSAMPPRRSAVLTVFRGATAINDGTTAIMAVPLRFMPYKHRSGTVRVSSVTGVLLFALLSPVE